MKGSAIRLAGLALVTLLAAARPAPAADTAAAPLPPDITRSSALENFDYVWERVRDTHFDPTLNGVDWYGVRDELRPAAARCRHIDSLRVVLWRMLGRLGQSHFGIIPSGRYHTSADDVVTRRVLSAVPDDVARPGPGIDVRRIGGGIVVVDAWDGGAARDAGIGPGWEILAIDGERCDHLVERFERAMRRARGNPEWTVAQAPFMEWALIQAALAGPDTTAVELVLRDPRGATVTRVLERRACPWPTVSAAAGLPPLPLHVQAHRLEAEGSDAVIGVLSIHFFWLPGVSAAVEDALDALGDVDAMVVDVRGNLGGLSAAMRAVASYFTGSTLVLGTTVGRDGEMPMVVRPRRIGVRGDRIRPFTGPLAILTDGLTGSASELFAAGLHDAGRARLFGEPTAGSALPAIVSPMPNGDGLLHAAFDFHRPGGESLEGAPLVPDVAAPRTRSALSRGRDPGLEAAVAWLVESLAAR